MPDTSLELMMDVAQRRAPADLVFRNISVLNVFTETMERSDVSIVGGTIARVAPAQEDLEIPAAETIDGSGSSLIPGLIDAHTHIEMSLVSPTAYASIVVPQGTTSAIVDMHDVANVGFDCMRHHAIETAASPLKARLMLPPCVPATPKLETAGFDMTLESLCEAIEWPDTLGIGEAMDFGRILDCEPEMMAMLSWAKDQKLIVDGHCPNLSGDRLQAYAVTGASSCHESGSLDELREKYALGFKVIMRRGSLQEPFLAGEFVNGLADSTRVLLSTDGCVFLDELIDQGGMINALRQIIAEGIDPIAAIKIASYNTARAYRIDDEVGSISVGRAADLIVVSDLDSVAIEAVYIDGELVTPSDPEQASTYDYPIEVMQTVRMDPVTADAFRIETTEPDGLTDVRVKHFLYGTVIAEEQTHQLPVQDGVLHTDASRDLIKISVFDRHRAGGEHTNAIVSGFNLTDCSFGGSIGQDAQNLVVVGTDDDDMALVVNAIREMHGGVAVASNGQVVARVALPFAGIMSPSGPGAVRRELDELHACLEAHGCTQMNPTFNLSLLLTCAVIPELKITNRGLVDVDRAEFVPLMASLSTLPG
ncbi:MAG: adenine deaminase C-terminal domain-containing protein [Actinomycetota bacterium]